MDSQKKIIINKIKQLIPLNDQLSYFKVDFEVKTDSGKPFRGIVLNQEEIDGGIIQMKNAPAGIFSGQFVKDSGEYTPWYIIVDADSDLKATLSINLVEIEKAEGIEGIEGTEGIEGIEGNKADSNKSLENFSAVEDTKTPKKINWLLVGLIVIIVLIIGYFLIRHFTKGAPATTISLAKTSTPFLTPVPKISPAGNEWKEFASKMDQLPDLTYSHTDN